MPGKYGGIFIAEGTSDSPLADIVETLFLREGVSVVLSRPDFASLNVKRDVTSRVAAGLALAGSNVDLIVVHRDADSAGHARRLEEIDRALAEVDHSGPVVPVVPVRMTEAWLLLDEAAIRQVAGNPRGKSPLALPALRSVESTPDPKVLLRDAILAAASVTGRKRERLAKRFFQSRRQLLERLDPDGPVTTLPSWIALVEHVSKVAGLLRD